MDELEKKIQEIANKWKSEMSEQNITNWKKFYRLNFVSVHEDMEGFWDWYFGIKVEDYNEE
jgi:hypothetical protein